MFLSLSTTDWSNYGTDIFATYLYKAIWHMCMLQSQWGNCRAQGERVLVCAMRFLNYGMSGLIEQPTTPQLMVPAFKHAIA